MPLETCLRLWRVPLSVAVGHVAFARDFSVWEDVFGICKFERRRRSGSSSEALPDVYAAFGHIERVAQPEILPVEGGAVEAG